MRRKMEPQTLFRARFTVAWPIWAGGYPNQREALDTLAAYEDIVMRDVKERVNSLLGQGFTLSAFQYYAGSHNPIVGLWPRTHDPNSITFLIEVEANSETLLAHKDLTNKITDVAGDLEGMIATFFRTYMPHAQEGANIYDVESR